MRVPPSLPLTLAATLSFLSATRADPIPIRIDVQKSFVINGHAEIQNNLFGTTAYAGAVTPATIRGQEVLREINLPLIGMPGGIDWCSPPERPTDGAAGIARWYASPEARSMIRDRPLMGDRYMYGRILPACRRLGIEPMIYILRGPAWAMGPDKIPLNNEEYAALVVGYIGLLREFDPQLRYVHLGNEPNAYYFKSAKYGKEYGETFVAVARALKAKFPDIQIGGPVLLWPPSWPKQQKGTKSWYTWDEWTKPFLDVAGNDLDFFDFHHYDMKQREDRSEFRSDAAEEVQLISNELWLRRGKPIPVFFSEWGVALHENEWKDPDTHWRWRGMANANFLLDLLDEPDKVACAQQHDLSAMVAPDQSFGITNSQDSATQTPTYWLYWLLRHTRGTRLAVQDPAVPGLRVAATRETPKDPDVEGQASVFVLNDSDQPREVALTFAGIPDWLKTPRWERLFVDAATKRFVRDAGTSSTVTLPPHSAAAATVLVPRNAALSSGPTEDDFYGQKTLQEFTKIGEDVTIPVIVPDTALKNATAARVRIGLQNADGKDEVLLKIGADTYPLKSGLYFQELPLKSLPKPGENQLIFTLKSRDGDHRIRVSTAALIIEKQ
jgi:hypothetical protein